MGRPWFEIWFAVVLDEQRRKALWLRQTYFVPKIGEARATIWGAWFDADGSPKTRSAKRVAATSEMALGGGDALIRIGDARNGLEAIAQTKALRPDVVLMDISMPVMDGVEATRNIHAALPSVQVIGLSTFEKTPDPHPIELAGAVGYFQKDGDMRRLVDHVLALRVSNPLRQPAESG